MFNDPRDLNRDPSRDPAYVPPPAADDTGWGLPLAILAVVVVIGGLGSMSGALVGALIVGMMRAVSIAVMPEMELLSVYLVVVAILILKPAGLFGKVTA